MALKKLIFQPGINRDRSNYSSEGSWYSCDKIRFRQGYPEKIGGWTPINITSYVGDVSSIIQYGTTDSNEIISIAINSKNILGKDITKVANNNWCSKFDLFELNLSKKNFSFLKTLISLIAPKS